MKPELLRNLSFALPAVLLGLTIPLAPRQPRALGALLLAFTWNLGSLAVLNGVAAHAGWWRFEASGNLLLGAPIDLLLGWALLWGPVALLLSRVVHPGLILGFALFLDWTLMPAMAPLLQLGPSWLLGEVLVLALALAPGLLFGTLTWDNRQLNLRAALHLANFGLVVGFLLPHAVLVHTSGSWAPLLGLQAPWPSIHAQVLFLLGLPGLVAVQEFAVRGGGTPVPFDGPVRLVQTGPYAHVRNPMQLSTAACFAWLGLVLGSPWVAAIAAMAAVYGMGLASWHEQAGDLDRRLGPGLALWRASVRPWLPRWRPYVPEPSTLWVAQRCELCRPVGEWIARRSPVGLEIRAAEDHPESLNRMRYEAPDGFAADGMSALGLALGHIHLGWAMVGWIAGLPGVRWLLRVLVDASGGGPRTLASGPQEGSGEVGSPPGR